MSLAKFRKVFKGGKKTATPDLSEPKKRQQQDDKNQSSPD